MKLILSRKGFDSGTGGYPSPILPDGHLYSFPIPEGNPPNKQPHKHNLRYRDLSSDTLPITKLLRDLTQTKPTAPTPNSRVHLDPDLNPTSLHRLPGWKPSFGQAGAAERHLRNQAVGPGDLFLFFGWFRQVELVQRKYRYVKNAPDLHVIFGWLQIGDRISLHQPHTIPPWLHQHPHAQNPPYGKTDAIYTATETLALPGLPPGTQGGGLFNQFHPQLQLTRPGHQRSQWQLPDWFWPQGTEPSLSYHRNPKRWRRQGDSCGSLQGDRVLLQTVGRGQEFVLPSAEAKAIGEWLGQPFRTAELDSHQPCQSTESLHLLH